MIRTVQFGAGGLTAAAIIAEVRAVDRSGDGEGGLCGGLEVAERSRSGLFLYGPACTHGRHARTHAHTHSRLLCTRKEILQVGGWRGRVCRGDQSEKVAGKRRESRHGRLQCWLQKGRRRRRSAVAWTEQEHVQVHGHLPLLVAPPPLSLGRRHLLRNGRLGAADQQARNTHGRRVSARGWAGGRRGGRRGGQGAGAEMRG